MDIGSNGRQRGPNATDEGPQGGQNAENAGPHQGVFPPLPGRRLPTILRNAGNAGRQQGLNAGNARRQQGGNATAEGPQRGLNAGNERRQQGGNATAERPQTGQNAGNAIRQQGGNATAEGPQRGQNAGNAGRQQGWNAGNARRRHGRSVGNEGQQRGHSEEHAGRRQDQNAGNTGRRQWRNDNNSNKNAAVQNKIMSFTTLEDISKSSSADVFTKLSDKQNLFTNLLQSPITKPDVFVLILRIIHKVTLSPYEQLKQKFILEMCNPIFVINLQNYIMTLPYTQQKSQNGLYWNGQDDFWDNFVCFCDCLVNISPSTAFKQCKCLIDAASRSSLEGLKNRHEYASADKYESQMQQIRDLLIVSEKVQELEIKERGNPNIEVTDPPPECFRQLSVTPTREDLLNTKPYLRPNLIKGAYQDVEHYLDVQFRLLREDCFEPLRRGICDYLHDRKKKKYENIRIFQGVEFTKAYTSKDKLGSIIQFGDHDTRRFKNIKWDHNKRFIFGSLLLLTNDDFKNFICATIIDRDPKLLAAGEIPVNIINNNLSNKELYNGAVYTMVESSVYFEPYYHVMRALQDPKLPETLPMQQYIVQVEMEGHPPAYLKPEQEYVVKGQRFAVLGEQWPSARELQLDESQRRAFRLALSRECAVLQGPPGTGKTHVGVAIAAALLRNLTALPRPRILLLCYTNHALDQFLAAIATVTSNVARIGGQSKDADLAEVNLSALRKGHQSSLFCETRRELFSTTGTVRDLQNEIDMLDRDGVLSYDQLKHLPEAKVVARQCERSVDDPIEYWLFEKVEQYEAVGGINYVENHNAQVENDADMQVENHFGREDVILDDYEFDNAHTQIQLSFSALKARKKVKTLQLSWEQTVDLIKRQEIEVLIDHLLGKIKLLEYMKLIMKPRLNIGLIHDKTQVFRIPTPQRWAVYLKWERLHIGKNESKLTKLKETLNDKQAMYEEARMAADAAILKTRDVIGITTSGAARVKKLLMSLETPIVIVEEAAEVLEQHIISSLTRHCKHLILIGDHQQLRPAASSMRLARHYDIEVSLFERLLLNQAHSVRLSVQHRMRPELAELISPHIYPELLNHASVETFPSVRGLTTNLFFFTHDYKEMAVQDTTSRCNEQEADLVLSLANYIMQQDYKPEDVTILAAYAGQLFYMMKERGKYRFLSKVKITVVDNYQGEESNIILLSLVRNNDDNKIGFLGTSNRICVALSRAREGFYIFGNIDILKRNSELWSGIAGTLDDRNNVGKSLILRCERHTDQFTEISKIDDFNKCPEGGCLLKCDHKLPCTHPCNRACHGYDRNHKEMRCNFTCARKLCQFDHICPLMCATECEPCVVLMEKTFTKCGHINKVLCHEFDDPFLQCPTIVTKDLPCKHQAEAKCHFKPEDVRCLIKCDTRLKCGHVCRRFCHLFNDPNHETYLCEAPCARMMRGCTAEPWPATKTGQSGEPGQSVEPGQSGEPEQSGKAGQSGEPGPAAEHLCRKLCHEPCDPCTVEVQKKRSGCSHKNTVKCNEDVNAQKCTKNCARSLPCGHHCRRKCGEPCGGCIQKITIPIPECGHDIQTKCGQSVSRDDCKSICNRTLQCGHPCPGLCSQTCDPKQCKHPTSEAFDSPCGHKVNLPCGLYQQFKDERRALRRAVLGACSAECGAVLGCGHDCAGRCGECAQGRFHRACARPCEHYNVCGHICKEPCQEICPPCNEPCEVKCPHSHCRNRCGEPCSPCQEKCRQWCPHVKCKRACDAPCATAPCSQPCPRRLRCGHACRGLCGAACPPACRRCRPDDYPTDLLGDPLLDTDRLVLLEDCRHIMDVETLDTLMNGARDSEEIVLPRCPFCRKPIINTYRYKDIVNEIFRTKINPVKRKIYGFVTDLTLKKKKLDAKFSEFNVKYGNLLKSKINVSLYNKLHSTTKKTKRMHLLELNMQIVCLDILERVIECYQKHSEFKNKHEDVNLAFQDTIAMICNVVKDNTNKLSTQMQTDIANEIKRLNASVQLTKVLNLTKFEYSKMNTKDELQVAVDHIIDWKKFDEEATFRALDALQKKINVSGVISKQEREMIVKAMNFKPGHWFKCPNGHFYCIGECGGAMQQSRCPECGAAIGGANHELRSDNSHAREMDGSAFPAWSDMANMANYRFE